MYAIASRHVVHTVGISLLLLCIDFQTCHSFSGHLSGPVSRRQTIWQSLSGVATLFIDPSRVTAKEDDPRKTVVVRLQRQKDVLGLEVFNTQLRGNDIVAIRKVISSRDPRLQEGMILKGYSSAEQLVNRIRAGPFPIELEFVNLAAGGDAFSDFGTTIVTPKDALELAQKTENTFGRKDMPDAPLLQSGRRKREYAITRLREPKSKCAIQSRRGDLLEIDYEAAYEAIDGRKVTYDASAFRGTGLPYQMVLGSGDMIPGVDQGLYDMCPGEIRLLNIPPVLGHGNLSTQVFGIPPDYVALEWKIQLVSIDTTIREDSNEMTRADREARALY
jgi:hypothetical protein